MTKRIFRTIFVVAMSIFLISAILFMSVLYNYFSGIQKEQLRAQVVLAARGVENEGIEYLNGIDIKDYRITWINADGNVLYDSKSNVDEMKNHLDREEVKQAFAEGYGASTRYSSTLTQRYIYGAKRLSDGTVIRVSVEQNSLLLLMLGMLQPIVIIFLVAIVLSDFLASRLSKEIVNPLNEIDLDKPLENNGYDELLPLLSRIDIQQKKISRQREELKQKKNEFEVMTSAMSEGIILLNGSGDVLSINKAAARLFGADMLDIGDNVEKINRNAELTSLFEKAKGGKRSEITVELGDGKYQMMASPVVLNNKVSGIVLLILDVTEKEKTEQLRREFTANVSHELKTPLHTISGCAELLANGMVKSEDVSEFSNRIYSEAQRMIQLVEDIIRLSHLDEGATDMKWDRVDLYQMAKETVNLFSDEAAYGGIKLTLCGKPTSINANKQLIQEIIYNLCDNAIKYNRENGSVTVEVEDVGDFATICVSDTGIGIPTEQQSRIFERFYRADQSRSKKIVGTGLGLSIVKHAVKLHNAEIELHSVVNEGTQILIKFPKK